MNPSTVHPAGEGRSGLYCVWRIQHGSTDWIKTAITISARSPRDAQARLRRRFAGAGFTCMSLMALPAGVDPSRAALATGGTP